MDDYFSLMTELLEQLLDRGCPLDIAMNALRGERDAYSCIVKLRQIEYIFDTGFKISKVK